MAVWLEMNRWHWSSVPPGPCDGDWGWCDRTQLPSNKPTSLPILASEHLTRRQSNWLLGMLPFLVVCFETGIKKFCSVYGHLSMWSTFLGFLFHSCPHIQYSICLLLKSKWFSGLGVHSSLSELPLCDILACHHQRLLFSRGSIWARVCPSFGAYCGEWQQHRLVVTLH